MPNLAQITIAGHLGRDAELKDVKGTAVLEWSMAVTTKGGREETTNWYRCALWGTRGEKVAQYLTKGTALIVTGGLVARDYTTKDGKEGYSLDVRVNEFTFAGGGGQQDDHAPIPAPAGSPAADDDDIPF